MHGTTPSPGHRPRASIIVPTYNRQELLRSTLRALTGQDLPITEFEVIVADDGSSDRTAEVVESFRSKLRILYHFQPDLGFRAAEVRNAGARLARGAVLVFLDTGILAGPSFVGDHVRLHEENPERSVVLGYTHGFLQEDAPPDLSAVTAHHTPRQVLRYYGDDVPLRDRRHGAFLEGEDHLRRLTMPWMLAWTMNLSVGADDFWSVGGFDEDFRGWGCEDIDLGYRLHREGLRFVAGRGCWAIDSPHERDVEANRKSNKRNALLLVDRHRSPEMELCWWLFEQERVWPPEEDHRRLLAWTSQVRGLSAVADLEALRREISADSRVAVLGCGAEVPDWLPSGVLADFDRDVVTGLGEHRGFVQTMGLRTALPDRSFDSVVITSRLEGLWERWREDILAEAHRIAGRVHLAVGLS